MYGFFSGISDTDEISYCPKCGAEIAVKHADGSAKCGKCGYWFGVIEYEVNEEKED